MIELANIVFILLIHTTFSLLTTFAWVCLSSPDACTSDPFQNKCAIVYKVYSNTLTTTHSSRTLISVARATRSIGRPSARPRSPAPSIIPMLRITLHTIPGSALRVTTFRGSEHHISPRPAPNAPCGSITLNTAPCPPRAQYTRNVAFSIDRR